MNSLLKFILPVKIFHFLRKIKYFFLTSHFTKSYAQDGEDLILRSFFYNKPKGFYIDIGAHHPKRFSNTYHFYKIGWIGMNVDAMPGSMKAFNKIRSRDINIEAAVSDVQHKLRYYMFNEPAFNGFSKTLSDKVNNDDRFFIEDIIDIETITLEKLLDQYLENNQEIDFLSIDVEGLDFKVLKSNNFLKYRPIVICVEIQKPSFDDIQTDEISIYLKTFDYEICAKTFNSVFFIQKDYYYSMKQIV